MNLISVTYLVCAFISFESAITVLRTRKGRAVTRVYTFFALDFTLLCIFFSQFVASSSHDAAWFWNRATLLPGNLLAALFLHYVLLLTVNKFSVRWSALLLYLPGLYMSAAMFQGKIISTIVKTPYGWDNVPESMVPSTLLIFGLQALYLIAGAAGIIVWGMRTPYARVHVQARPLVLATLAGACSFLATIILVFSGNSFLVTVGSDLAFVLLFTLFILGVRYSMARHNLMEQGIDLSAEKLVTGMRNPVFITDSGGGILAMNQGARELARAAVHGRVSSVQQIFSCSRELVDELEVIRKGIACSGSVLCAIRIGQAGLCPLSLRLEGIMDGQDVCRGFFIIAGSQTGISAMRSRYRVTARQMEVICLAASGRSNEQIAEEFGVSRRTVERHFFNIYNRLAINNRVELLNLCRRYNILSN